MRRVVLVALLFVPVAAGAPGLSNPEGPVPATLYAHFDGRQDFVLNPRAPPADVMARESRGVLTHSLSCAPNNNLPGLVHGSHHTVYGYFQSGDVRYDDGLMRLQGQRGLVADLHLDPAVEPRLTWILETTPAPVADGHSTMDTPVIVPEVTVRVTMREGDDISREHIAFDAGRLIAMGQSQPATLSPVLDGHPDVRHEQSAGEHLYIFDIPLAYAGDTFVAGSRSFNLRVDVYIATDQCDPDASYYMLDWVRFHSSADHRPHLDLSVLHPLKVVSMTPSFRDDRISVDALVRSPWGAVDLSNVVMSLDGTPIEDVRIVDRFGNMVLEDGSVVHCHCYQDRDTLVSARLEAGPGMREVRLDVHNGAGTANATGIVTFEVGEQRLTRCVDEATGVVCVEETLSPASQDTPLPFLGLWALLVAAAWRVRQRF